MKIHLRLPEKRGLCLVRFVQRHVRSLAPPLLGQSCTSFELRWANFEYPPPAVGRSRYECRYDTLFRKLIEPKVACAICAQKFKIGLQATASTVVTRSVMVVMVGSRRVEGTQRPLPFHQRHSLGVVLFI
jgi:hypothetical protein